VAQHELALHLQKVSISGRDFELEVRSAGKKLGELHFSKGTVDWRPAYSKGTEYRLAWEKLAELFEEKGRKFVQKRP